MLQLRKVRSSNSTISSKLVLKTFATKVALSLSLISPLACVEIPNSAFVPVSGFKSGLATTATVLLIFLFSLPAALKFVPGKGGPLKNCV